MNEQIRKFETKLNELNGEQNGKKILQKLYRGYCKKFASERIKHDFDKESNKNYAYKIFYFGEKPNINKKNPFEKISFKDILGFFKGIDFTNYPNLKIEDNSELITYLNKVDSKAFVEYTETLCAKCAFFLRNHYLMILHQLDSPEYKDSSSFISTTEDIKIADGFSANEIKIHFWQLLSPPSSHCCKDLKMFKGVPFPEEKEISLYGGIFPHYIYLIEIDCEKYYNPKINELDENDLEIVFHFGFDIDQRNIKKNILKHTSFREINTKIDGKIQEL